VGPARPAEQVDAVSFSRTGGGTGRVAADVQGLCAELQRGLDPEAGRLLRVHLFTHTGGGADRLALVAHHLAVDGLSWRVLLDDLAAAYRAARAGRRPDLPPAADFYQWAARAAPPPGPAAPGPVWAPVDPAALSWALEEGATARLVARHGAGQGLESLLLAAFASAAARAQGRPRLRVEVETHGRPTADGTHLDTVGWFTAVKRVEVDAGPPGAPPERVRAVAGLLSAAPELPLDAPGPLADAGFNFLGTFRLPDAPDLGWSPAREHPGPARCAGGDPAHPLRLTARVVGGRLVADLVYARPEVAEPTAARVLAEVARAVADATGAAPPVPVRAPVSTSGHLLHLGEWPARAAVRVVREPARVLLTGATGYLGGHLLAALLDRGARVTCLVRGGGDAEAARRLGGRRPGVEVVAGDVTAEGLGLSAAGAERARAVDTVVHAAADVRLVAAPEELARTNTAGVRRLLAWLDAETTGVRFHHLSTLAVAGGVEGPARRFSEADLDIGQTPRTPYERTKFDAEVLVREWAAAGRRCYVHRSGHVAAHSRTGAFQRNVADNRVYQVVRGYVLAGAAPRRPAASFAFSHVDTVAAGIAALAVHPGAAPGAYHVETPHRVPHDVLVGWMAGAGYPVALVGDDAYAAALERAERDHPAEIGLAAAWARVGESNVDVDCAASAAALDRLGVRFAAPTPLWWGAALAWAGRAGFLPAPVAADRTG
jgi:thioester reductase-like protein